MTPSSESLYPESSETQSQNDLPDSTEELKFCGRCRNNLPLNRFSSNRTYKGWNSIWCKQCISTYGKEWRKERMALAILAKDRGDFIGLTKICSSCKEPKSLNSFNFMAASPDYHCYECTFCMSIRYSIYRKANKESIREKAKNEKNRDRNRKWRDRNPEYLKKKNKEWHEAHPGYSRVSGRTSWLLRYGVTEDWYVDTLDAQGGGCAICGSTDSGIKGKRFHIDHNHLCCSEPCTACDECRRGILCNQCNLKLGYLENIAWKNKAIAYLNKYSKKPSVDPDQGSLFDFNTP